MEAIERLKSVLNSVIKNSTLKKIVFSKPKDKAVLRAEGRIIIIKEEKVFQLETFLRDGKALHKNLPLNEAIDKIASLTEEYHQINIISTAGNIEAKISSKGKMSVIGKLGNGEAVSVASHNREKENFLKDGIYYPFLFELGVSDKDGRVFDKKRAKFRQIDRFLHYIDEVYPRLRPDGELYLLDLCCGKSYLTFAAYWFLTEVKGRKLKMCGADRKPDVIEYCSEVAARLSFDNLSFICCDITEFKPERRPDMVLSLHACDISTDIVLTTAARLGAEVILSTPCCQHEVNSQLKLSSPLGKALSPIIEHSLLKQKLAVALTDALRCKRLEASGYSVSVTEFIDPENTPKNLMIRALRSPVDEKTREKCRREFDALCEFAQISLFGGNGEDKQ